VTANGSGASLGSDEYVLELVAMIVAELCEHTENHHLYTLKE
jgi:hypothetical protein